MKKYLLALAASVLTSFASAANPVGHIYSILPNETADVGQDFRPGAKVKFRIRLYAADYEAPQPTAWQLVHMGTLPEEVEEVLGYSLKVGVVVSGQLREAEIIEWDSPATIAGGHPYTDLVCQYTVRQGDLALPLALALKGSTDKNPKIPSATESKRTETEYYLFNADKWAIVGQDENQNPVNANFYFCDQTTSQAVHAAMPDPTADAPVRDFSLSQANLRVSGLTYTVDETIRTPEKKTATISMTEAPALSTTLYAWSSNEAAVKVVGKTVNLPGVGDRAVATIVTEAGKKDYAFEIESVGAQGDSAEIILSAVKGLQTDAAGDPLENYLVKTVTCGLPKEPEIKIEIIDPVTGLPKDTVSVETPVMPADGTGILPTRARVSIYPAPAAPLTVTITPTNLADSSLNPFENIALSDKTSPLPAFSEPTAPFTVTISANTTTKDFSIYPLGGDIQLSAKGIKLAPSVAAGSYELVPATYQMQYNHKPVVISPAEGTTYDKQPMGGFKVPLHVTDCYHDLEGVFTVTAYYPNSGNEYAIENVKFSALSPTEITLLDYIESDTEARLTITNADEPQLEASTTIKFTVKPPKIVKTDLYATAELDSKLPEGKAILESGTWYYVGYTLSEKAGGNRYAFLAVKGIDPTMIEIDEPANRGATISNSGMSSLLTTKIRFKDGTAATGGFVLKAILSRNAADKTQVDQTFGAEELIVNVQNENASVKAVYIDGAAEPVANDASATPWPYAIPSGTDVGFDFEIIDPGELDVDAGVWTLWSFEEGKSAKKATYRAVKLAPGETFGACTYKYSQSQSGETDQNVQVMALDKDLLAALGRADNTLPSNTDQTNLRLLWRKAVAQVTPYSFKVHVALQPHIVLETVNFIDGVSMTETGNGETAGLRIALTDFAQAEKRVRVFAEPVDEENPGKVAFPGDAVDAQGRAYIDLTIPEGETEPVDPSYKKNGLNFNYKNLNGTSGSQNSGWKIYVKFVDDTGTVVEDGYFHESDDETIYVMNLAPTVSPRQPDVVTTNKTIQLNQPFTLQWTPNDVKADLAAVWPNGEKGLKCEWYLNDAIQSAKTTYVTVNSLGKVEQQETELRIKTEGFTEVKLVISDLEGEDYNGTCERVWYYYIQPTKRLQLTPVGPSLNTQTKYRYAKGRGQGHVWANGPSSVIDNFSQIWNYSITEGEGTIYAIGYKPGDSEDGTLGGEFKMTPSGNSASETDQLFTYAGEGNNYFYRWVHEIPAENGGVSTFEYEIPEPTLSMTDVKRRSVQLDKWEKDKLSYLSRNYEAIFSKEYITGDNLGDINADGIPDLVASFYALGGSTVGTVPEDDISPLNAENADGDYLLTLAKDRFGSYIPGVKENWVDERAAFDAKLELRGFHDGLNDAAVKLGIAGVEQLHPDYNSDDLEKRKNARQYSDAEMMAWAETGYDKAWSPENPTDPTLLDTDGDKLPDGYEYYFWYWATVGNIVDGKLVHFTGEKYNPLHPEKGDPISWQEIAKKMDPNVPNTAYGDDVDLIDSDNDGLVDMLEFELGTNPFLWDSDGDGLPDGYEVMFTNLDPHKASTNGSTPDGARNDDGDFMATMTMKYMTIIGTINPDEGNANEQGHVKYYATYSSIGETDFAIDLTPENMKTGWRLAVNGVQYMIADGSLAADKVYREVTDGGTTKYYLADDFNRAAAFEIRSEEGVYLRGAGAYLMKGALLEGEPTQEEWTVKTFTRTISGTDPEFVERAYSVWVYGTSGKFVLAGNATLPAGSIVAETRRMSDVTLLHHHVYQRRGFIFDEGDNFLLEAYGGGLTKGRDMGTGFNPTTGWFMNNSGLVGGRYSVPVKTTPGVAVTAKAGKATDTAGFSLMDEFLLMNWRYHCGLLGADALVANVPAGKRYEGIWSSCSTRGCFTEESGRAQAEAADTDGDGVPDGWELYVAAGPGAQGNLFVNSVSFSPNNAIGEPTKDVNLDPITGEFAPQEPGFGYLSEFCGTDSMAAYAACPSIPSVHPTVPAWLNKFYPTDPWSCDTDCDGLTDDQEASFTYGTPSDNGKYWIAGAGMNPCSWDTDMDGLPDMWEYQFKGTYATPENLHLLLDAVQVQDYKRHLAHKSGDSFFVGGMDPTTPDSYTERHSDGPEFADNKDFDYDGLDPWQEYLTGFIRAFRYDDPLSPWTVPQAADFDGTDAEYLEALRTGEPLNPLMAGGSNPNLVFGKFDVWGAYGSKCRREWDLAHGLWYFFPDGPNHCLKIPYEVGDDVTNIYGLRSDYLDYMGGPAKYATCDPRLKDSDNDGMDDYYELFHGLNPLYGGKTGYDLIRDVWPCPINARQNYWTEKFADVARGNTDEAKLYDFAYFPWMAGDPEADPDGDDIRNVDEAIQPNTQAVKTWLHTDPTPLWMTDSSYAGSIVNAYYAFPTAADQRAADAPVEITPAGADEAVELPIPEELPDGHRWLLITPYNWEFEENEGYDSDHDGLSDYQEATSKSAAQSDPQDEDDPHRRQAMYFPGENSALQAKDDPIIYLRDNEYFFLEFTVECWVRPEDTSREQVILERTIETNASSSGDRKYYRRNFEIGINAAGQFYAAYDHNGTGEPRVLATAQNVAAINAWSHLAATYDGTMLRLYVNGEVVAKQPSTLRPAIPILTNLTTMTYAWLLSNLEWENGLGHTLKNFADRHAIIFGASAVENDRFSALALSPTASTWDVYDKFYKGFLDEVRIWDGARTEKEIAANYKVRFTAAECLANRQAVFAAYKDGAHRHVDTSEMATKLPAELAYHYTFDNLLAAAAPENVATSPYGFTAEIGVGGKARVSRPEGYVSPWWFALSIHSMVYNDYAYIPTIPNTMAHLPRFDKTTMDSVYWSEDYAGFVSALSINQTKFDFPMTHELFVNYQPVLTGLNAQNTREMIIGGYDGIPDDLSDAYNFANRIAVNYKTDLLPLGGAYARFCTDLWDDEGATTNTDVTHSDDDNDLLADWWEKLVVAGGKDGVVYTTVDGTTLTTDALKADTVIKRNGIMMSAIEAYHRDLAGGAVEIGDESYLTSTQYRQTVDEDKDGIPDWWEQLYGIDTRSADDADADPDGDGLSNFQEFLITEVFRYANLNPLLPRSDGYTLDYLLKVGELYFGEIFTDHDGMDNAWEKAFDKPDYVNRYKYDPNLDEDEDGWSNYAEYRAGTDPTLVEKFSIDGYMLPEHPVPVVKANIAYNANHAILAPLVFMAWNEAYDPDMTSAPDAIWTIGSGGTSSESSSSSSTDNDANLLEHEKFLGRKPANEKTLFLTGGAIVEGSVKVMTLDKGYGIVHYNPTTGRYTSVESGEPDKAVWYYNIMDRDGKLVLIGNALDLDETVIGSVNYVTGEITIDFGHEQLVGEGLAIPPTTTSTQNKENDVIYHFINLDNSYVKIEWKSTKAGSTAAGTYYLTDADKPTAEVASRGYLREGKATFLAFIDEDGDGKYTPGEFFGVARGVDVGWFGATLDLELTETHPVFARVDLSSAMNDREQNYGNESGNWTNVIAGTTSGGKYERVRVVRTLIDGTPLNKTEVVAVVPNGNRVVMDKWIDVKNARSYLHEGDFLSDLAFDLDWSTLTSDCKFPIKYKPAVRWDTTGKPTAYGSEVSLPGCQVVYRIVLGNGTIDLNVTNNIVGVAIARSFDASQVKPEICADLVPGVCYQARPTFSWSLNNRNSYTAFKLQIADADLMEAGKTFDQARVYDSGLTRLPAAKTLPGRTADVYTWTADPIVGNQTALAKVLGRAGNWKWRVSVYNAKFKTDNWSDTGSFSTAVNLQQEVDDHGYGLINVSVKYPGPEAVLKDCDKLTQTKGIVRVQAFESDDFAGTPAAETVVTNRMALTDIVDRSANAQLCGLKPGRYFVRAYVDTDGDLKKADWESSGFARTAATVVSTGVAPTVELYIDDADTDNDSLPDAWEYATYGNLTKENAYVQPNGDIVLATMTYTAITNGTIGLPKNFPSASLQFFRNFDAARLLLGLAVAETTGDSLADIRAAVEKNVKPGSVKVTSLELDTTNSRVKLTVVGDLENSIAGNLLGPAYVIPQGTRLRVRVLRKSSLVESEWTLAGSYPITVSTAIETTLTVDVKEDLSKAGFYKVEVVKESDVLKETNN